MHEENARYVLLGPDRRPYRSPVPGRLGGHRRNRVYGRMDCRSALRAIGAGGYVPHRVFFLDEPTAVAAGFRPCAVCMPEAYRAWKGAMITTPSSRGSPRIPDHVLARSPRAARPPDEHTGDELARLLALLRQAGADSVAIGHGRHRASIAAAHALHAAWTSRGGIVPAVVDWPATAASWLKPARRLTVDDPDAWVVADTVAGCAQVLRRLAQQPNWTATRTFGLAGLADPGLVALAAPVTLTGMAGPTATGGTWRVGPDGIVTESDPAVEQE